MSKAKSAEKPHKRGFRLIFQAGGPAFLRSAALFPVVKCVEVCACQIEKLSRCRMLVVCGKEISNSMSAEIGMAEKRNIICTTLDGLARIKEAGEDNAI